MSKTKLDRIGSGNRYFEKSAYRKLDCDSMP